MIASFFQSLEQQGVAYLLISGQAAVLYGAATFSEDVDLWIKPTTGNACAFLSALSRAKARYYKLTPPITTDAMLRGHGFHFTVPDDPEFYLDVMGRPPRVPSFDEARSAATVMPTAWGKIPTIGIRDLVAVKTTQRLGDYPVIGQLVLRYLEGKDDLTDEDLEWAVSNVHTVEDLDEILVSYPEALSACPHDTALHAYALQSRGGVEAAPATRDAAERFLGERMLRARRADREYWGSIIAELRALRRDGRLMPVGRPVKPNDSAAR